MGVVTNALILALVAVGVVFVRSPALRLYRVATLFHEGKIVENFRSSTQWGMPHRLMKHGIPSLMGPSEDVPLPASFWVREEGTESKEIFLDEWLESHWSTGMTVLKVDAEGKTRLLHERYWRGNTRNSSCISWSMGKTIVATAFGIAVEKGFIGDIEKETVTKYLPQLIGSGYEGVALKHVLQMSSGVAFDEDYFAAFSDINVMGYWLALGLNIDQFCSRLKRDNEPGTYNRYVSIDTQVLSLILAAATNQTVSSFIEEHIWSKGGFEADASFLLDNEVNGAELGFGTIGARTIDFARFGALLLNKGRSLVDNAQLVPQKWVHDSTHWDAPHLRPDAYEKKLSNSPFFGYGYQIWLGPDSGNFMLIGVYNQFVAVFPDHEQGGGIVVAKNSAWPGYKDDPKYHSEVEAYFAFKAIADAFR